MTSPPGSGETLCKCSKSGVFSTMEHKQSIIFSQLEAVNSGLNLLFSHKSTQYNYCIKDKARATGQQSSCGSGTRNAPREFQLVATRVCVFPHSSVWRNMFAAVWEVMRSLTLRSLWTKPKSSDSLREAPPPPTLLPAPPPESCWNRPDAPVRLHLASRALTSLKIKRDRDSIVCVCASHELV